MKNKRLSRRDFFKLSAFSSGTAALAAVVGLPTLTSLVNPAPSFARAVSPHALEGAPSPGVPASFVPPLVAPNMLRPTFTPMPSVLMHGQPSDVSMGWDGTIWSTDSAGTLHAYDLTNAAWQGFDAGIDAAAVDANGHPIFFKGNQVWHTASNTLQTIAQAWPNLPISFTLGVEGAASTPAGLFLFKSGRYVNVNDPTTVKKLTDILGWSSTSNFPDGAFDYVLSGSGEDAMVTFARFVGNEVVGLSVDLATLEAVGNRGNLPLTLFFQYEVSKFFNTGAVDAVLVGGSASFHISQPTTLTAFKSTSVYAFKSTVDQNMPSATYIADAVSLPAIWPATWNTKLIQAPSGRVGNLWAVAQDGSVVQHDGARWTVMSLPGGVPAASVSVGQDDTVYTANSTALYRLSGAVWVATLANGLTVSQVSVGDASRVWVRDSSNGVHVFDPNTNAFIPKAQVGTATHLAANADGTLWHCNAASPQAFRFISEGQGAPEAIPLPNAASVQRVASTGFGVSWCLVQQASAHAGSRTSGRSDPAAQPDQATQTTMQLYQYTSPYLFKTSKTYWPNELAFDLTCDIAIGSNCIFLVNTSNGFSISALDAQTGQELWSAVMGDLGAPQGVVYDARRQQLYCSTAYGPANGFLQAFDASGHRLWQWEASTTTLYNPTLSDSLVCLGDGAGNVYLINVDAVQQQLSQNLPVQPAWTSQVPNMTQDYFCGQPTFSNGVVYVVYQNNETQTLVTAFDVVTGKTLWSQSSGFGGGGSNTPLDSFVGQAVFNGPTPEPALFVNAGAAIWILRLDDQGATSKQVSSASTPNTHVSFSSSMTPYGGKLYVGDSAGCMNLIDVSQFAIAGRTPAPSSNPAVYSNPVFVADSQGNIAIFFTRPSQGLWLWDPVSGNLEQLGLVDNSLIAITYDNTHGVLYGACDGLSSSSIGQVFAIRANQLIQDERAFIIESQLMQDYDAPAAGQTTVPASVRYQTHVTLVDNFNTPLGRVSVKMWADAAMPVRVDGQLFQIDPNTPAVFQCDESGSFTVMSGSVLADQSDAPDMSATPLRLWAAFMDSQERIVIYPDSEFHERLSSTVADASDDPQSINLSTATSYDSSALCSSLTQAQQTAQGVQTLIKGVGLSGTRLNAQAMTPKATAPSPKYAAYADLGGLHYQSANTPSSRPVAVAAPVGLSFSNTTFTSLTASDAATQIDAMVGMSLEVQAGQLGSFSSDLKAAWSEIKQAVKTDINAVKQVVVSLADAIYVGLQYVVNGVTKVVKTVITDIADVATIIGAFFAQLGKDILHVLEALGRFFHLDEIFNTATFLTQRFKSFMAVMQDGLESNAHYANDFINGLEVSLDDYLTNIANRLSETGSDKRQARGGGLGSSATTGGSAPPSSAMGNLKGMGTTPHSCLTVGPAGSSAAGSSQAVQGMWGLHKIRQGAPTPTPSQVNPPQSDPLSSFIAGFLGTLSGDQMNRLTTGQSQFTSSFPVKSSADFMKTAIGDLLNLIQTAVHGTFDIVQLLVSGMLNLTDDLLSFVQSGGTIDIPVLSALWKASQGSLPTFVEILAFVAAIPVTYLYRTLAGHWLSQDMARVSVEGLAADPPQWLVNAQRIASAVLSLIVGVFTGINDTIWLFSNGLFTSLAGKWVPFVGYGLLLLQTVNVVYPALISIEHPSAFWIGVVPTLISNIYFGPKARRRLKFGPRLVGFCLWWC